MSAAPIALSPSGDLLRQQADGQRITDVDEDESLNVRLKTKKILTIKQLKLKPRPYQSELCAKALRENVIIYLGTGLGKTFITVLFLNNPTIDHSIQNGRKIAFLAPTQDLIKQQAEYMSTHLPYSVKLYCGKSAKCGLHIDHWNASHWKEELKHVELMFMTPQIFTAAIATNLLDWTQFCAVIFDEFHHASYSSKGKESKHAYARVLKHYNDYFSIRPSHAEYPRPRLIGLTASLINRMPKNRDDIRKDVSRMEIMIHGSCVTDCAVQDIRPTSIMHCYTCFKISNVNDIICSIFENFTVSLTAALKLNKETQLSYKKPSQLTKEEAQTYAFLSRLKLAAAGFSIKPTSFPKVIDGLNKIRQRCGLWMLRSVTFKLIKALEKHTINSCLPNEMKLIYRDFTLMLQTVYNYLDSFLSTESDGGLLTHTRPKPKAFLERLNIEYQRTITGLNGKSDFSCIAFVISRLEVVALNAWLQTVSSTLPAYKFIKCDYAIGLASTASSKYSCITKRKAVDQAKMLKNFREKALNVIITTSVLEEGIDLPVCSTVIRYDGANNFRQYVQSRGRARQAISTFVTICEEEKYISETDCLDKFHDFEKALKAALADSTISSSIRRSQAYRPPPPEDVDDVHTSEDKKIMLDATTAKTILSIYCNRLAQRTPFTGGVRYEQVHSQNLIQTIIYLPSGCPLNKQGIAGNFKSDIELANNSAILAAVNALIEAGEIGKNGVPARINIENVDLLLSKSNLKPLFEPLHPSLEGIRIGDDERELFLFEPKLRNESNYLRKNYADRTYKLIKIRFQASREDTRQETRAFFERPVFGIITDSRTSNDWIPNYLNGHYGQYQVQFIEVLNNFCIKNANDHTKYLNYTHNLLYKYLSILGITREQFVNHCQFYIVPLNEADKPDTVRMYQPPSSESVQVGHIVKMNTYNTLHRDRFSKRDDRLFLVRRIRTDMTATSNIPGRRNITFLEDAEEKYGRQVVASNKIKNPIIEVMPISKEFGLIGEAKKSKRDYSTDSLFFIDQFLDLFDTDAAYVFQAHMLPEMIYRLYVMQNASDLDGRFLKDTKKRRQAATIPINLKQLEELDLGDSNANAEDVAGQQVAKCGPMEIDEVGEDVPGGDSGTDSDDCDANSTASDDTDFTDDSDGIGPDYKEMITKRTLSLEHDNDDGRGDLKRWDMSQYTSPDLVKQTYEHYISVSTPENPVDNSKFSDLQDEFKALQRKLINQIEAFEGRITSDVNFLDEDAEFGKRTDKVDRNIIPPIHFDRNCARLKEGTREGSLIEALTLRRVSELYSLEGLENVGDSYLKYVVSVVLYMRLSGNEGFLTASRSRLISNEHFTYLAKKNSLGSYAITRAFSKDYLTYMMGKTYDKQNSRREDEKRYWNKLRPKSLADLVESIVGSYLVYHGEFEAILALEWLGLTIFDDKIFDELHENAVVFAKAETALINDVDDDATRLFYLQCKSKVRRLEEILDYKFNDPSYLVQAITHASATRKCTRSYERLEFLGDAILDYLVTSTLIKEANLNNPGEMTSSRSALVNNCAFAKLAMRYRFDLFIQYCNADIYDELIKVRAAMEEDPDMIFLDIIDYDKIVKLLGDVFESIAGAIYLDSGCSLDSVWSVYYPMMKESIDEEIRHPSKNLTALLHEMFPGRDRIRFEDYDEKCADGDFVRVRCIIVDFGEFEGTGISKKEAKKRAVRDAVKNAPSLDDRNELNRRYLAKHGDGIKRSRSYRQAPQRGGGRRGGSRGGHSKTRHHGARF